MLSIQKNFNTFPMRTHTQIPKSGDKKRKGISKRRPFFSHMKPCTHTGTWYSHTCTRHLTYIDTARTHTLTPKSQPTHSTHNIFFYHINFLFILSVNEWMESSIQINFHRCVSNERAKEKYWLFLWVFPVVCLLFFSLSIFAFIEFIDWKNIGRHINNSNDLTSFEYIIFNRTFKRARARTFLPSLRVNHNLKLI